MDICEMETKLPPPYQDFASFREVSDGLMRAFVSGTGGVKGLVRHQTESFNYFLTTLLPETLRMNNPIFIKSEEDGIKGHQGKYALELRIYFEEVRYQPPAFYETNGLKREIFPNECRVRNITYASQSTVTMRLEYTERNEKAEVVNVTVVTLPDVNFILLPVMVRSMLCNITLHPEMPLRYIHECSQDPGGYFLMKGLEKVIQVNRRQRENYIQVSNAPATSKFDVVARVRCMSEKRNSAPKQILVGTLRKSNCAGHPIAITLPKIKDKAHIDMVTMFRALGARTDKEIMSYILDIDDEHEKKAASYVIASFMAVAPETSGMYVAETIEIINEIISYKPPAFLREEVSSKRKLWYTKKVIDDDVLSHTNGTVEKLVNLGYIVRRVIWTKMGWLEPDVCDCFTNARFDLPSTILANFCRTNLITMTKNFQRMILLHVRRCRKKEIPIAQMITSSNIEKYWKPESLRSALHRALSNGDFTTPMSASKVGYAQSLNRQSYIGTISHLRRLNTGLEKSEEMIEPRKLHMSGLGFECSVETPDSNALGLTNEMALGAVITLPSSSAPILAAMEGRFISFGDMEAASAASSKVASAATAATAATAAWRRKDVVKIFVNGSWIGVTEDIMSLLEHLRALKTCGAINIYTSIVFIIQFKELRICTDGGRIVRPVLRVRDNKLLLTKDMLSMEWNDLLRAGVIEYIDPDEHAHARLATFCLAASEWAKHDPKSFISLYDYAEISEQMTKGLMANTLVYTGHNPCARDFYQSNMGKQTTGVYATNHQSRMDRTSYTAVFSTKAQVKTRVYDLYEMDKVRAGYMTTVALMLYDGYNQEDSLTINAGSIDRGLFFSTVLHTETDVDKNIQSEKTIRTKPDPKVTIGMRNSSYEKINSCGFVEPNVQLRDRDVFLSKLVPIPGAKSDSKYQYEDESHVYHSKEVSYVHRNLSGRNGEGESFFKTQYRTVRKPEVANKFSSRSAQKGTGGRITRQEEMPFLERTGVSPDLILNAHCLASRMTVSHVKETLMGTLLAHLGMFGDGGVTPSELTFEQIGRELEVLGLNPCGEEILIDGRTGQRYPVLIFCGEILYQVLKHMSADKIHCRTRGPVFQLTRQPLEGRAQDGGLRLGEMEKDVVLAYGATSFIQDRWLHCSDDYGAYICKKCGAIAAGNNGQEYSSKMVSKKTGPDMINFECRNCDNFTEFSYVELAYCLKLAAQELESVGTTLRIKTE